MTPIGRPVAAAQRPLRLAMIGGGAASFIGPVHRRAAELDRRFAVVAGVWSSAPDKSRREGQALGVDPGRAYRSLQELIAQEAARPQRDGVEAVAIMSPNDTHAPYATACLAAGLHVICEKPLANSVAEGIALSALVDRSGRAFCLTHNYSGYPMVRQARAMVAAGVLGELRMVHVEYLQGGMALPVERGPLTDKLRWKIDPARAGASLVMGDIGTHALHLASYVSGSRIASVCADVGAVVPQRSFHDYAALLLRLDGGARGSCIVTQAAAGAENNLSLRVYGSRGMLEWQHASANYLRHAPHAESVRILGRGDADLHAASLAATRIVRGHPEGFVEAFANLYGDFADAILAGAPGAPATAGAALPSVRDGLQGLRCIEAALTSSAGGGWVSVPSA